MNTPPPPPPPPTTDHKRAAELQRLCDILALDVIGAGSAAAGGNTLTAMALNIANLSASCVRYHDRIADVGINFTIAGPLTASLTQRSMSEPFILQDNLSAHISEAHIAKTLDAAKPPLHKNLKSSALEWCPTHPVALSMFDQFEGLNGCDQLLLPGEKHGLRELLLTPVMVTNGDTPEALNDCVKRSHKGRLFVVCSIPTAAHANKMAPGLLRIVNGTTSGPPFNRRVQGFVAATITPHLSSSVSCDTLAWLDNSLWLTDGDIGPPIKRSADANPYVDVFSRYRAALQDVIVKRLERDNCADLNFNFIPHHHRFLRFLQKREQESPGILAATQSLYVSLEFGLRRMFPFESTKSESARLTSADIEAFARYLVRRMVHARTCTTKEESRSKMLALASRILRKLELHGPCTARDLTRRINNLRNPECIEALEELIKAGFIQADGAAWKLMRPAIEFNTPTQTKNDVIDI